MLDISRIKAVTLDLDDTLWPIWPTIERAERALNAWLAPQAPLAARLIADMPSRMGLRAQVERLQPDIAHDMSAMRLALIRLALHQSAEDMGLAEPAFELFYEHRMKVDFYEDALPALVFLAQRMPLVAVSNGNADLHRVGIGAHFHASVSAHEFGVPKPDVRIFHAAARAAGVAAHEVLHVGDDAALDVLGACNAGMQTVWVNRGGHAWTHAVQPDLTVSELGQLCVLFAESPNATAASMPLRTAPSSVAG